MFFIHAIGQTLGVAEINDVLWCLNLTPTIQNRYCFTFTLSIYVSIAAIDTLALEEIILHFLPPHQNTRARNKRFCEFAPLRQCIQLVSWAGSRN